MKKSKIEMQNQDISHSRRKFIQNSAMIIGMAAIPGTSIAQGLLTSGRSDTSKNNSSSVLGSQLGLGCMGMSEFYGTINENAVQRTLAAAADYGVTLFDTADMYGRGANEELIGKFAKSRRNKITIATKFGIVREGNTTRFDNTPSHIKEACETSLRRLNVDAIDIYYVHRVNPSQPIEETMEVMASLVREGKIKSIGLSETAPETIRRAQAIYPVGAVQTEYSLFSREPELEIIPLCAELGITFVPYAPLSRGLLTGKSQDASKLETSDFRKGLPRFQPENFTQNSILVERFTQIAGRYGYSAAQLALAWILIKNPGSMPIPGSRTVYHLVDNLAAATIQLSPSEMEEIDTLFTMNVAAGRRYTDDELKTVNT